MPRGGAGFFDQSLANASRWSFSVNLLRSFDYQGGHDEDKGLTDDGTVIEVPLHRHEVNLDINRLELGLQYSFRQDWAVRLLLPYEEKDQSASLHPIAELSAEEWQAALNNGQIHHRDESYHGLADGFLRLVYLRPALFSSMDQFVFSTGVSLPLGQTEEDPILAGQQGREHLHLQFGNGTYDPLIEMSYYLTGHDFELALSGFYRHPVETNDKGYRGSRELNWQAGLSRNWTDLRVSLTWTGVRNDYAYWDGMRDENTGLSAYNGSLGVTYSPRPGRSINATLSLPISQRNLGEAGESFEVGPTVYLGYAMPLNF